MKFEGRAAWGDQIHTGWIVIIDKRGEIVFETYGAPIVGAKAIRELKEDLERALEAYSVD